MQIQENELEHAKIELLVTVEPTEIREWIEAWCKKQENYRGPLQDWDSCDPADEKTQNEAKEALLGYGDYAVMDERTPSPLTKPILVARSEVGKDEPFMFSVVYIPFPQMDLTSYEPVEVKMVPTEVSDKDVDERLRDMLKDLPATQSKEAGAVVEPGDTVELSMSAMAEGQVYEPLSSSMREYRIGDAFMPKDFEDMLLGMKTDEEASVDLKVPKGQPEDGAEQEYLDVSVSVKVLRILRDDLTSLNDESVGLLFPGMHTVEQLKRGVRQMILDEKQQARDEYKTARILDVLSRRVDGKLGDDIYEAQYEMSMMDLDAQLEEAGITKDEFYEMQQTDEQNFRLMLMMDIRSQLTQSIALDALARHEKLTPTEEDRKAFFTMVTQLEDDVVAKEMQEKSYASAIDESVKRMMAQKYAIEHSIETVIA